MLNFESEYLDRHPEILEEVEAAQEALDRAALPKLIDLPGSHVATPAHGG